jgi:hypothetical protein
LWLFVGVPLPTPCPKLSRRAVAAGPLSKFVGLRSSKWIASWPITLRLRVRRRIRRRRDAPHRARVPARCLLAVQTSVQSLPAPVRAELRAGSWHPGCPVSPSRLRLLSVPTGLRSPRAHRPARPQPRRRCSAYEGVPSPLRAALPDSPHGRRRRLRTEAFPSGRRRCVGGLRVPTARALSLLGREGHRQLVGARLWRCGRSEPNRKPVRRLRANPPTGEPAVPRSLSATPGDGDPGGRPGVPDDRLGMGRRLEGLDKDYMHFSASGH